MHVSGGNEGLITTIYHTHFATQHIYCYKEQCRLVRLWN